MKVYRLLMQCELDRSSIHRYWTHAFYYPTTIEAFRRHYYDYSSDNIRLVQSTDQQPMSLPFPTPATVIGRPLVVDPWWSMGGVCDYVDLLGIT